MNLLKCGVISNGNCSLCQLAMEDERHVFWGCPEVTEVLDLHYPSAFPLLQVGNQFFDAVWHMMKVDSDLLTTFITILWTV